MGVDLQDAKPEAPAPVVDLSQFSLAPAGSDMGQPRPRQRPASRHVLPQLAGRSGVSGCAGFYRPSGQVAGAAFLDIVFKYINQ